jgi:hypothetical protein
LYYVVDLAGILGCRWLFQVKDLPGSIGQDLLDSVCHISTAMAWVLYHVVQILSGKIVMAEGYLDSSFFSKLGPFVLDVVR